MTIAQNRDARIPIIPFNEPVFLTGRFTGANTANLVAVAGTTKSGITIARTGAGLHTVTVPTPVGVYQMIDMWVNSAANATPKTVQFSAPANNATTIAIQIVQTANVSNVVDISSTEELNIDMRLAATAYP